MSLDPKKYREFILQILYAYSVGGQEVDSQEIKCILKVTKKLASSLSIYAKQIIDSFSVMDDNISLLSKEWSLERISKLELQILRFGLFELDKGELEVGVVISEMIRLCKKFSTEASSEYIHAMLDASIKQGSSS